MAKNNLFFLIKSLETNERRYFVRFAQFHIERDKNRYIRLFELIRQQDTYDEAAIRKQLDLDGHKTFAANLSYNKNYLYQLILRCLRSYHNRRSARIRLHEMMIDADILTQKGLQEQARALHQKAQQMARKYSLSLLELDLVAQERKIVRQFNTRDAAGWLEQTHRDCKLKAERLIREYDTVALYEQAFILARNKNYTGFALEALEKAITELGEKNQEVPDSTFDGVAYFHLLKSLVYRLSGRPAESNQHLRSLIGHFEKHPALLEEPEYQDRYLNTLSNFFINCHALGQLDECRLVMEKFSEIRPTNPNMEAILFHLYQNIRIFYHFQQQEYDRIVDSVPVIEAGLRKYAAVIPKNREMAFRYNIAVAFYFTGDVDTALTWLQTLLGDVRQEIGQGIRLLAMLFHLALHYEKGNYQLLDNILPNARRQLRKHWRPGAPELLIAEAIQESVQSDRKDAFLALRHKLETENGFEEFREWLNRCTGEQHGHSRLVDSR